MDLFDLDSLVAAGVDLERQLPFWTLRSGVVTLRGIAVTHLRALTARSDRIAAVLDAHFVQQPIMWGDMRRARADDCVQQLLDLAHLNRGVADEVAEEGDPVEEVLSALLRSWSNEARNAAAGLEAIIDAERAHRIAVVDWDYVLTGHAAIPTVLGPFRASACAHITLLADLLPAESRAAGEARDRLDSCRSELVAHGVPFGAVQRYVLSPTA